MGQESDTKSRLVIEICSLSGRSIACAHKHPCSSAKSHFIDWYRLLGVEENADTEVIRRQYHKLALQLHPDKNKHPKADIAFKLVLEAYSCLSDNVRRKAFNLQRWKHFCTECNKIPYIQCDSLNNSCIPKLKGWNATNNSRSFRILQGLKDVRDRFREEARVMESCLRTNSALRRESPIFNPPERPLQSNIHSRSRKESPIFDPSDYLFDGYPHGRSRICKKPDNFWHLHRKNVLNFDKGRYESPIFENRPDRAMLRSKSTCVRS